MSLEQTAFIDIIAHDSGTDAVVLTMVETRPWSGSDEQLFQLQEKLNAYLSFALDSEMVEAYPQFAGKKVRVELRCAQKPDSRTAQLSPRRSADGISRHRACRRSRGKPKGGCGGECACRNESVRS